MRIVAGSAKGRPLLGPKDAKTIRPTADRVRETLFNVLGQFLDGERVLDLYAGTGALAFEALSRGASEAVLVDRDREALSLCRANAANLGFEAQVEILAMPVAKGLEKLKREGSRFDLVFADPPYATEAVMMLLDGVGPLLTDNATLVLEHGKTESSPEAHGALTRIDQRRFGDTLVSMYRRGVDAPII